MWIIVIAMSLVIVALLIEVMRLAHVIRVMRRERMRVLREMYELLNEAVATANDVIDRAKRLYLTKFPYPSEGGKFEKFASAFKNFVELLVTNFALLLQEIDFLTESSSYYEYSLTHDALTGVLNRRAFEEDIISKFREAKDSGTVLSLVMFDIDRFKKVNDTYGHPVGDLVLKEVARRTLGVVPPNSLYRYGGEEFAAMLVGVPKEKATKIAEGVRERVAEKPVEVEENGNPRKIKVTISAGVAEFPRDALTYEGLIEKADEALYRAKKSGRNRVEVA